MITTKIASPTHSGVVAFKRRYPSFVHRFHIVSNDKTALSASLDNVYCSTTIKKNRLNTYAIVKLHIYKRSFNYQQCPDVIAISVQHIQAKTEDPKVPPPYKCHPGRTSPLTTLLQIHRMYWSGSSSRQEAILTNCLIQRERSRISV